MRGPVQSDGSVDASGPRALGRIATDLVGSSGSRMTRNRSSASGGSPGASAVMTGSMLVGWNISLRPSATPVAIAPTAERRRQLSNRLDGVICWTTASSSRASSSGGSSGPMLHDRAIHPVKGAAPDAGGAPRVEGTRGLPLSGARASEVPRRAEVTFVDIQGDARFDLPDVGRPQRVLPRPKDGFGRAIGPPMRSQRQSIGAVQPGTGPLRSIATAAHLPNFTGNCAFDRPRAEAPSTTTVAESRGTTVASVDAPRRAEIRRRGKRGRIWRAGTTEAYEKRAPFTK